MLEASSQEQYWVLTSSEVEILLKVMLPCQAFKLCVVLTVAVLQNVVCFAERCLLSDRQASGCDQVLQTAYAACDYLMVMGLPTGRVIKAYAPN